MHHPQASTNFDWLPHNVDPANNPTPPAYQDMVVQPLGDRQAIVDSYLEGCVDFYGAKGKRCTQNEVDRIRMSLRQPASMYNYTELGFTKIRAPEHVFSLIQEFWKKNKDNQREEKWPIGNVYVNHWEGATSMVSVEDASLEGGGFVLKEHIWNAARDTISAWTGQQLAECSLYGIRVYKEGAILAPHVDRLPLVASAIINVDQDVDEPWPLEVIGHDGKAYNVTMLPGDLVLYESHSVLHGRPFALKGRFMANVFM
jgi:prolyl 4-hydroxylase